MLESLRLLLVALLFGGMLLFSAGFAAALMWPHFRSVEPPRRAR